MAIDIQIGSKTVTLTPYIARANAELTGYCPPNYYFRFTDWLQKGTYANLKDILRDDFNRLKDAGVYTVETYQTCTYEINGTTYAPYMQISYDPLNPNVLNYTFYRGDGSGNPQPRALNYAAEETSEEALQNSVYIAMVRWDNLGGDSGKFAVALPAVGATYQHPIIDEEVQFDTSVVPPVKHLSKTLFREYRTLDELLPVPAQCYAPDAPSDYPYEPGKNSSEWRLGQTSETSPHDWAGFYDQSASFFFGLHDIYINDVPLEDLSEPEDPFDDVTPDDPYEPGYPSDSDYVPQPGAPTFGPLDYGFIHAYMLDTNTSNALAQYMLTDSFINGVKKLIAEPINYIISTILLPLTPMDITGVNANIIIGGLDTQIPSYRVTKNFVTINCGTVDVSEEFGGFQDYSPNTKLSIHLPFIGDEQINIDDVMGGSINCQYIIDVLTGECLCTLKAKNKRVLNGVIGHYKGCMCMDSPVTNNNYGQKLNAIIGGVSSVVGAVGSAGVGDYGGAVGNAVGGAASLVSGTLMKPTIERSGTLGGGAGQFDVLTPYLIIERPVKCLPQYYNTLEGCASASGGKLSSFKGYAEFSSIDLSGISCTDSERDEILSLLKGGVFV